MLPFHFLIIVHYFCNDFNVANKDYENHITPIERLIYPDKRYTRNK